MHVYVLIQSGCECMTYSGPKAWRRGPVLPGLTRAVPHHFAVDGTADTVVQLHIQFGQNVGCRRTNKQVR